MKYIYLNILLIIFMTSCNNIVNNERSLSMIKSNNLYYCDDNQIDTIIKGEVTYWKNGYDKALVFTWDDSSFGIEDVVNIFNKHDMKVTFFVNTAAIDNFYTKIRFFYKSPLSTILSNALEYGHEIGTHTHNHVNLAKITLNQAEYELRTSSEKIHNLYGYYPTTMSHPHSYYNESIDSLVRTIYMDSRYSCCKDKDTTIRYMQVRKDYPFTVYKKNLDSFMSSNATTYIFAGHQLDNMGYEPMSRTVCDSLLTYINFKYLNNVWVATFEDLTLYNFMRKNIKLENNAGYLILNIDKIKNVLKRFIHPNAHITLRFPNSNLDFSSKGLVNYWYDGRDSYCTIDLRLDTIVSYSVIDSNYNYQKSMRNGIDRNIDN